MNVSAIHADLERHFRTDLEDLRRFLRRPSISYTGEGIRETAAAVADLIASLGGWAEVVETPGHPIVYGELWQDAPRTLLIYGMYDVMPTDEDGWISDPFGAEIHDLEGLGPCVICRGAVNTKGPLAAFFSAMRGVRRVEGKLPVNLLFAIEGEEEMGSRSFPGFAREYAERLRRADAVLFPFFEQDEAGMPSLVLGTKGLLYLELICTGGAWGGPGERAVHGSYNAWVKSPAWRLTRALASLVDDDENIRVEGFFDAVRPLPAREAALLDEQIDRGVFDAGVFREAHAVRRLKEDDDRLAWHRLFSQPQLNIDGLFSGYTGPETKTVLPHQATAKLDVRMVPDMDPDAVLAALSAHLDGHGFSDIDIKVYNKYPWSKISLDEPAVQAMIRTYEKLHGEVQVWPINPGSAPYYVFERLLKLPYVTGGLGHGARQHSSNEYCTVAGVLDFERSMVTFVEEFTRAQDLTGAQDTQKGEV